MQKLLQDQTAIVTGGTAGIGKAIAIKFAEHGARVAIFGTNVERGNQVVEEISKLTGEPNGAIFFQVDVANNGAISEAIEKVLKEFDKVDILVNNAGITRDKLLIKMSESDWDDVMAINAKSCYNTCHALVRQMMKARRGKIVNMSSVVGLTGNTGQTNYAASKAAIIGFTKALAKELAGRNICVNCIAPGFVETAMTEEMSQEQKNKTLSQIPVGRMGTTEDIANAALFLASDLSAYITGHVIRVDGGMAI
ncbi:MAG: 3-oxoacyl-[acyl-carrier-protein] reductase FabG [Chlamydiae bacterium]|nr:3-oxoacyl-[acyl-carrier-protein] reductase FabG [Chlamydiota bacterium]